jgi:zinc protease
MIHTITSHLRLRLLFTFFTVALLSLISLLSLTTQISAQTPGEPDREKLLNGLTVLFSPRPGDPNILVKLRIRSGAAFDLAGKGGTMALLGDAFFPDPTTRDYVADQLGGKLEVTTSYDGIDITISGKANELERIVELLRGAVVTPQLTPENVARIRDARIKLLSEKPLTPAQIADQAIAVRLFGGFPYAHPPLGTLESVRRIDRADLLLARERFLTADNATVVVVGGVEKGRTIRALRQLLGPWNKSDRSVPATFRQPDPPDARVLVVNHADSDSVEIRLAVKGLARSDYDTSAAMLIAEIVRRRWESASPAAKVFARHEAHALPGMFVLGASVPSASAKQTVIEAQQVLHSMSQNPPSPAELERARNEVLTNISQRTSEMESLADLWLDIETFKFSSRSGQANSLRNLSLPEVQRVASRLFKDAPVATVVVGNYEQLKTSFDKNIELRGERSEVKAASDSIAPAKKPD